MTLLIAALNLPVAISFEDVPKPAGSSIELLETSAPLDGAEASDYLNAHVDARTQTPHGRSQSLNISKDQAKTIIDRSREIVAAPIPRTPGATTDTETFFKRFIPKIAFNPVLSKSTRNQSGDNPPRPAALHRNKSASDLLQLMALDNSARTWGVAADLIQPVSLAQDAPESSILHKAEDVKPSGERSNGGLNHIKGKTSPDDFTENNYLVRPTTTGNSGLYAAINAVVHHGKLEDKMWIGTLGMPTDVLKDSVKEHIATKLEFDHDSLVVWASDTDISNHYNNYCKSILWPAFHYQLPDNPKSKAFQDNSWEHYVKVNEAFAETIVRNYKQGDTIWIHDYHLLLVPGYVRKQLPTAKIGLFIHSAFPSSEIFRCLATRYTLLNGILGADMVGFQIEEYKQHFLQTCSRLLNVEATRRSLYLENGRVVEVASVPLGIDVESVKICRQLPEVKAAVDLIADKYAGKKIIIARDRYDGIHGIREKLRAYRLFLERHKEWRQKVVLIQIAIGSTKDRDLRDDINETITDINTHYSSLAHQPVVFLPQDIDYSQYVALLSLADCLMITSLREGMNLTSHEFIVCQDGAAIPEWKHAPLILSEFTGAAAVLRDYALLVNPWHVDAMADAMNRALNMTREERESRWNRLNAIVCGKDAVLWYEKYMKKLDQAYTEHSSRKPSAVPKLNLKDVQQHYTNAERRLFIVDLEGTLTTAASIRDHVSRTPKRVVDVLSELTEDKKNMVYVMSQRRPEELDRIFKMLPRIGLIAENGAFLKDFDRDEWHVVADLQNIDQWKDGVWSMLTYFQERMPGSQVVDIHSGLLYFYHDVSDQEQAFREAGECANLINDACQGQKVAAIPIEHGICVQNSATNKASATQKVLERMVRRNMMPDFIFVVGDSREDEYVFKWAHNAKESQGIKDVVTVSVGQRNTEATCALSQGPTAALSTLEKLARTSAPS